MRWRSLGMVGLSLLAGGIVGYMLASPSASLPSPESPSNDAVATESSPREPASMQAGPDDEIAKSRENAITRAVRTVSPAVVGINVISVRQYRRWSPWGNDPFFRQFFGDQLYSQQVQSLGSGFLVSSDGYILTNDHVAGNANEITVTMTNGEKYEAHSFLLARALNRPLKHSRAHAMGRRPARARSDATGAGERPCFLRRRVEVRLRPATSRPGAVPRRSCRCRPPASGQ